MSLLTVVIPTLGRKILLQTIQSLIKTNQFQDIEIVVVGEIPDATILSAFQRLIASHENIQHISVKFERGDSSEKKNVGWRRATTEIVAFLDDDVVIAPDWVAQILQPFDDPTVGLASGPSLIPPDVGWFARLAGTAMQSNAAGYVRDRYLRGANSAPRKITWSYIIGCNMAYRRLVIESIGGFDLDFWPGEEMLASFKAGKEHIIIFNPNAWVYHYPRISLGRFCKQVYGYGATRTRLIRAGTDIEWSCFAPAIWVLSLFVVALLLPFTFLGTILLSINLTLYIIAAALVTLFRVHQTKRLFDLSVFFLIPLMHISYGLGEWVEFFRPNKDLGE